MFSHRRRLNMDNLAALLQERSQINDRLSKLLYGSTEIRESDGKKYLYVHYRDGGVLMSKYAGEYSQELANLIIANSALARDYKKRLRDIQKALDEAGYIEGTIDPEVGINIDLARRNLVDSIYKQSILEGVATTYSDTETLVNGGKVNGMTSEDVGQGGEPQARLGVHPDRWGHPIPIKLRYSLPDQRGCAGGLFLHRWQDSECPRHHWRLLLYPARAS
jgi:hypothetical protein